MAAAVTDRQQATAGSDAAAETHQESDHGPDQKHDEEYLRDAGSAGCDSAKSEDGGDQRDDEEDDGIVKHDHTWIWHTVLACGSQYSVIDSAAQSDAGVIGCRTRLT
jgi:hypothetical protein